LKPRQTRNDVVDNCNDDVISDSSDDDAATAADVDKPRHRQRAIAAPLCHQMRSASINVYKLTLFETDCTSSEKPETELIRIIK